MFGSAFAIYYNTFINYQEPSIIYITEKKVCPDCVCEVCMPSRCEGVKINYLPLEFEIIGNDILIKNVDHIGFAEGESMLPLSEEVKFYKKFSGNIEDLEENMVVIATHNGKRISHVVWKIDGETVWLYGLNNPSHQFEVVGVESITHIEAKPVRGNN